MTREPAHRKSDRDPDEERMRHESPGHGGNPVRHGKRSPGERDDHEGHRQADAYAEDRSTDQGPLDERGEPAGREVVDRRRSGGDDDLKQETQSAGRDAAV